MLHVVRENQVTEKKVTGRPSKCNCCFKKSQLHFFHCSTVLLTNYHNKYHTTDWLLSDYHTIGFRYHYIPTTRHAKQAEMDIEEQVHAPLRKNKVVTGDTIVQIETLINLKARYDFTL